MEFLKSPYSHHLFGLGVRIDAELFGAVPSLDARRERSRRFPEKVQTLQELVLTVPKTNAHGKTNKNIQKRVIVFDVSKAIKDVNELKPFAECKCGCKGCTSTVGGSEIGNADV